MTMDLGYLTGTAIFLSAFLVLVIFQIRARRFSAPLYWATIVASTTAGTTMADFADRSLGVGYAGGSAILFGCVVATLALWRWKEGSVSVNTIAIAAGRGLLLGHHHVLADARHSVGRLDRR